MSFAVSIDHLTKDYPVGFWRPRPYRALDRLTLDVQPGEIFGFLGPNGAGKTTTLKLLMQLVYPTSGHATILGRPLGDREMKRRIGYLAENPYYYDYLTAEELLGYFAGLFGLKGAEKRRRVDRLLDTVLIGAERRLQLRKFSKGMIQRVGLAQALLNDPEVIFLDEPMSGLDPLGRRDVRALILRLRDEGRTVFFSSHILSDAETLCSRVAILAKGRLVATGRLSEMLEFRAHGWEVVVEGIDAPSLPRLGPGLVRHHEITAGQYALEFAADREPQDLVPAIVAAGGRVLSLTPVRETLEDFFVKQVSGATWDRFAPEPEKVQSLSAVAVGRIAVSVFKESVRDKVLYNLVFFAILLIAASLLLGQLTAGQEVKIIKDLGLAATTVFGLFIAVFIGIGLVSKEVERRSIYALLVKPITRPEFIVGRYAGLVLTLAVNIGIMSAALYVVLGGTQWFTPEHIRKTWEAPALDPQLMKAIFLIFLQLAIITAIALLFSTFSSPLLSAALTFGLFVAGHFNQDLLNFRQVVDSSALAFVLRVIYFLLPNLAAFDVKGQVVHADPVTWGYLGATTAYGALYVAALLVLAVWIFSRRDFK